MTPIARFRTSVVAGRRLWWSIGLGSVITAFVLLTLPVYSIGLSGNEPPSAPTTPHPSAQDKASPRLGLVVNPQNRQESLDFYNNHYLASQGVAMAWTGDHANCVAGTTAVAFRAAIAQRINYFRAMAGIPADITLDNVYNEKAQQAALMMSVNGEVNHTPPPEWKCYTAAGQEAAGKSNLVGTHSVHAIDAYMADVGDGNTPVGHRRRLLYPQRQKMGTGDIPSGAGYGAANALWVADDNPRPRPPTREEFVAWPPPGFVPEPLLFARWSLAYPGADFAAATVTLNTGGQDVPVTVLPVNTEFGENTLVWEPDPATLAAILQGATGDTNLIVNVSNVIVDGQARSFDYALTLFNPADPTPSPESLYLALVRR